MFIIANSNLSKNDLEDIWQNLGLSTEDKVVPNPVPLNSTNDILVKGDYADDNEDTHMTREENYVNDLKIGKEGTPIQMLRECALRTRYNDVAELLAAQQSTTEPNPIQETNDQKT
ncbi:32241_t:CDS:2, partial [Racocetra persica]